jgi:hypothetical protein
VFVTNHVLSGALIGGALPSHPVGAFALGLGSHLVLDAMPHWGCDWERSGGPEAFYRVARRDGVLGLAASALALAWAPPPRRAATVAAIAGAVLLDLDKPCEYLLARNPFPAAVQRLHKAVQRESPEGMRDEVAWGGTMAAIAFLRGRRARRPAAGC